LITGRNFFDWWKGGKMSLKSAFQGLFNKKTSATYAKMLDNNYPVFSQFGQNIYASDIVQMAIDRIATEISKLQPKHIRTDPDGKQVIPKSALNRLFKFKPNPLMTTKDFLEKVIWLLYMNYNCFIYPMYKMIPDGKGGFTREYEAFYPLDPSAVTFLQDAAGTLFVKFEFRGGESFDLNYADVIHLRKKFSLNSIMGGGSNGQPDNTALLKILAVNDTVLQGLEKAVKTSMAVRGILKIATLLDDDKQQAERKRFEEAINNSESGILPMDLKGDYVDLKPNPKVIDSETLSFIQNRILFWYGVPLKIWSGEFSDNDYQAWYETTLEPIVLGLGQAFSPCVFTTTELNHGNEMVFYHRNMMYLSTQSKLELIKIAGEQGLLTDDQKLQILGYPPLEDGTGNRRTISLNYVSVLIADQYQLKKAGTLGSVLNTDTGGSDNDN
jgi:HK97 family phage portal protein